MKKLLILLVMVGSGFLTRAQNNMVFEAGSEIHSDFSLLEFNRLKVAYRFYDFNRIGAYGGIFLANVLNFHPERTTENSYSWGAYYDLSLTNLFDKIADQHTARWIDPYLKAEYAGRNINYTQTNIASRPAIVINGFNYGFGIALMPSEQLGLVFEYTDMYIYWGIRFRMQRFE